MYSSFEKKGKLIRGMKDDYVVLDVETTGLSPTKNDIIEFSAIKISKGEIIDTFSTLINPGYLIDPFITSLTGISNEMLVVEEDIDFVIDEIISFIGDSVILGHNTSFDIRFLYHNIITLRGFELINDYMDLLNITRKLYPRWRNHKLETVGIMLCLKNKPSHRAMNDCLATYEAYEICKNYMNENNIAFENLYSNRYKI